MHPILCRFCDNSLLYSRRYETASGVSHGVIESYIKV
jgi:hypothetical protein